MRPNFALAALVMMLAATGCTTLSDAEAQAQAAKTPRPDDDKPQRTERNLTVTWDNIGRGGAAMRQPGFVDVLATENSFGPEQSYIQSPAAKAASRVTPMVLPSQLSARTQLPAPAAAPPVKTTSHTSYSTYELQRWQRYCNEGVGMTEQDWKFVDAHKALVPEGAFPTCRPPQHTSHQYLEAWHSFCSGDAIKPVQMNVVKNSARPSSVPAAACKGKLP